jgi:hypothetical protein
MRIADKGVKLHEASPPAAGGYQVCCKSQLRVFSERRKPPRNDR